MSLFDDKRKYRLAVIVDADNQPSVLSLDALKSTEWIILDYRSFHNILTFHHKTSSIIF